MYGCAVLSAFSAAFSLIDILGWGNAKVAAMFPEAEEVGLSPETAKTLVISTIVFGMAIVVGLWIWMARKVGQGRAWARVLSTIFYGFTALGVLFTIVAIAILDSGSTFIEAIFSVVTFAIATYIVVLMYRAESSRYFDAVSYEKLRSRGPDPYRAAR